MIKRDNLRNKYSKNLFTEAKLNDSRKPLYIYQNLIGTSHSISDSMSYIFSAQPLFAGAFFSLFVFGRTVDAMRLIYGPIRRRAGQSLFL